MQGKKDLFLDLSKLKFVLLLHREQLKNTNLVYLAINTRSNLFYFLGLIILFTMDYVVVKLRRSFIFVALDF